MSQKALSAPEKQEQYSVEQLDLLAFGAILWRKSGWIALIVLLASGITFALCQFVMKPQWRAEAYIEAPREPDLGNYYALSEMYDLIASRTANRDSTPTHNPVEIQSAVDSLDARVFQAFLQNLRSYDILRVFWENSHYYKQLQTGEAAHDQALLEGLIANVVYQAGNAAKGLNDRVYLTLNNPKQATELLQALLDFVNERTHQQEYATLIAKWKNLFEQVKLAAEHKLGQTQQGDIVPVSVWESKLAMMRSVSPLDNQFRAFHYLKTPVQPLAPHSPNTALWVLLSAFAALIIGCAIVIMLALRDLTQKTNA
ncbi:Wzz/FepE/Etk N-terminal domain-containing protein [Spirabiliibacterium falconis]|uniref:Wzz/FepE/Etk N-terminal domain-containing protein n=1 Tax=Spirabiliibacterium falconis TaxID=572023 RepID=UPI001AAD18F4|nr:Wzz/FepE/Etk N-terminal domain-containing protein [Spirabiliibacterium falconis]MBE2895260.1 LPS chain length-determining protein [Spirabiliibacterium falconis]